MEPVIILDKDYPRPPEQKKATRADQPKWDGMDPADANKLQEYTEYKDKTKTKRKRITTYMQCPIRVARLMRYLARGRILNNSNRSDTASITAETSNKEFIQLIREFFGLPKTHKVTGWLNAITGQGLFCKILTSNKHATYKISDIGMAVADHGYLLEPRKRRGPKQVEQPEQPELELKMSPNEETGKPMDISVMDAERAVVVAEGASEPRVLVLVDNHKAQAAEAAKLDADIEGYTADITQLEKDIDAKEKSVEALKLSVIALENKKITIAAEQSDALEEMKAICRPMLRKEFEQRVQEESPLHVRRR